MVRPAHHICGFGAPEWLDGTDLGDGGETLIRDPRPCIVSGSGRSGLMPRMAPTLLPKPQGKPGHGHEPRTRTRLDMLFTCPHALRMGMIQIRNVPDPLHRELKARAARAGMTLSDYLLDVVRTAAARPEPSDLVARVRERSPVYVSETPAEAVRAERESR